MLGRRKPQRDLFRPDNLLSDYVGEHSLYGLLAQHGAEWFSDDSFRELYGRGGGGHRCRRRSCAWHYCCRPMTG